MKRKPSKLKLKLRNPLKPILNKLPKKQATLNRLNKRMPLKVNFVCFFSLSLLK